MPERERGIPCVSNHAMDRAAERLGLVPTREQWLAAVLDIKEGRALLLNRHGDREVYALTIAGVTIRAVWLPERPLLVTVLAPDMAVSARSVREFVSSTVPRRDEVLPPCWRRGQRLRGRRVKASQ